MTKQYYSVYMQVLNFYIQIYINIYMTVVLIKKFNAKFVMQY